MAMVFRLSLPVLLAILLVGCSKLFFYPMEPWVQNPENQGLAYEDIVLIHPRGMRIHGWWLPAEESAGHVRGTVYYLHGNAQNISAHLTNVQWLPARGYNVFLLDYRGYGLSEGKPRLPEVFDDVQLGLDWLHNAQRTEGPLVVFGQSLGGAMATSVLGEENNAGKADCVILEAAFASYRDITNDVMQRSWLLWPLRWMVVPTMPERDVDPERRIADIAPAPLLVMHSDEDPVVPYAHSERLYEAAQQPKTFQKLHGGHIQSTRDPAVQQRLVDFMRDSGCEAPPPKPESQDDALPGLVPAAPGTPGNGYRF
ncbi:MAG: lysophospholipase [Pseudomonadales bacterium]|nr:lysophospholipase [Pseudomonadales bacterium]